MKYAIKMYEEYADEILDPNNEIMYTEVETEIKQAVKRKDTKIDLNLFYELIEFASEIPYEDEDDHLNKHWEKSINSYLKKFYPKEKHYYLFPNEQATKQKGII